MQTDSNLIWTGSPTGAAQAITSAAVVSTGIYDLATGLMNTGTTFAAAPLTIGNATFFGEDLGVGWLRLMMHATIGTVFAGGTSLLIGIQGAIDTIGAGNFSSLTFLTYAQTGPLLTAQLTAGAMIPLPDWPRRITPAKLPRFIQLLYTPTGTFTTGTIAFAGMSLERPGFMNGPQYPSGFSVGA